jgi:hypothetical protein
MPKVFKNWQSAIGNRKEPGALSREDKASDGPKAVVSYRPAPEMVRRFWSNNASLLGAVRHASITKRMELTRTLV